MKGARVDNGGCWGVIYGDFWNIAPAGTITEAVDHERQQYMSEL